MSNGKRGDFVSEWFGYRTFPRVRGGTDALGAQSSARCPYTAGRDQRKTGTREERLVRWRVHDKQCQ